MYKRGHAGIGLIIYSVPMYFLILNGFVFFAGFGFLLMLALVVVPDLDLVIPGFAHRGISHSFVMAFLVAIVMSIMAAVSLYFFGPLLMYFGIPFVPLVGFVFAISLLAMLAHYAGDIITPAGVKLRKKPKYFPDSWIFSDKNYSLNLTYASNPISNWVLYIIGWITALLMALMALGFVF